MATAPNDAKGLSFGVWVPPVTSWPRVSERWTAIEGLGFDSLWVVDHFTNPFDPRFPWFEAWTTLAAMSAQTSRIRVGTLVTNIIYRNPAVIAKQAMTVDHISAGRMTLGLGAGSPGDPSHAMTGVADWSNAERVDRLEEIVQIVDHMLREPVTTYEGRHYQVEGAVMLPGPVQQPRPPLLIGAHGPRMLRLAARHADTWSTLVGMGPADGGAEAAVRRAGEMLSTEAHVAGRDPQDIVRSLCIGWTQDTPFSSVEAFVDFVGRYRDVGIEEFVLLGTGRGSHRSAPAARVRLGPAGSDRHRGAPGTSLILARGGRQSRSSAARS